MSDKITKKYSAFSLIELSIVILIIGILVAGVTQGSRLVREMRLSMARSLTRSSPVASTSGLTAWFDVVGENSLRTQNLPLVATNDPNNNTEINTWVDSNPISIEKNDATVSTSNYPLYKSSAINNLPALYFDQTNKSLAISSLKSVIGNDAFTIFIVQKKAQDANPTICALLLAGALTLITDSNDLMTYTSGGGSNEIEYTIPSSFYDTPQIILLRRDSSTAELTLNGTVVTSETGLSSYTPPSAAADLKIGFATGVSAELLIGEVIFFDRYLKNEEAQSVQSYLSQKWKISVN